MTVHLLRYFHPKYGIRLGIEQDNTVYDVSNQFLIMSEILRSTVNRVEYAIGELLDVALNTSLRFKTSLLDNPPFPSVPHRLAPIDEQDVWASGVTYLRSRSARQEEAIDGGDVYNRVYSAERPELFFKAKGHQVIGPLGQVGIRQDATWSVPEPELGIVFNPALEVVGFVIGNDMSSRDIEGANPLYLPQAKVYDAACALGPGILLLHMDNIPELSIKLRILRNDSTIFEDTTTTRNIKRTLGELAEYLGHSLSFTDGVVLLTGTGIVPPGDFSLESDDRIDITIQQIGKISNIVKVV